MILNTLGIVSIISGIEDKLKKYPQMSDKNGKIIYNLEKTKKEYKSKEIPDNLIEVYQSLIKKGKELSQNINQTADSKKIKDQTQYYLRYLNAVLGEINGELGLINIYYRWFLFTSILFLITSPQWFGFILPALFFVPIFLGMRGVKQRGVNGFYMSLSVSPIGFMTGVLWVRHGIFLLENYEKVFLNNLQQTGFNESATKLITIIPPILGIILVFCSIMMSYYGFRSKKLFV